MSCYEIIQNFNILENPNYKLRRIISYFDPKKLLFTSLTLRHFFPLHFPFNLRLLVLEKTFLLPIILVQPSDIHFNVVFSLMAVFLTHLPHTNTLHSLREQSDGRGFRVFEKTQTRSMSFERNWENGGKKKNVVGSSGWMRCDNIFPEFFFAFYRFNSFLLFRLDFRFPVSQSFPFFRLIFIEHFCCWTFYGYTNPYDVFPSFF